MSASILPTPPKEVPNQQTRRESSEEEEWSVVPLETSVLLTADDTVVLGASALVADGALFVACDERLPLGTEVAVSLVLPAREQTVRMKGTVEFWHEASAEAGIDQSGLGIAIDPNSVGI